MARVHVVQWRDIPVLVEASDDDGAVRRELSPRFQALVDAVAMRAGASESDAYLEGWDQTPPAERDGPAGAVADAVAAELEDTFDDLVRRHMSA